MMTLRSCSVAQELARKNQERAMSEVVEEALLNAIEEFDNLIRELKKVLELK